MHGAVEVGGAPAPAVAARAAELLQRMRRVAGHEQRQPRMGAVRILHPFQLGALDPEVAGHATVDARHLGEVQVLLDVGQDHLIDLQRGLRQIQNRQVADHVGDLHADRRKLRVHLRQPPHQQVGLARQLIAQPGGAAHVILERGQGGLCLIEGKLRLLLRHRSAGELALPALQVAGRTRNAEPQALDAGGRLLVPVARPLQLRLHVLEPRVDDVETRLQAVHLALRGGDVVLPRA